MKLQVQQWFASSRPFEQGVQLLRDLGQPSEVLLGLLEVGETSVARKLLEEALADIREEFVQDARAAAPAAEPPHQAPDRVLHPEKGLRPPEAYPEAMRPARLAIWPLKEEQQFLRGGLETCPDKELRRQQAIRIMAIERERLRHLRRLDHWHAHGVDLAAPVPVEQQTTVDRAGLERRRNTVRTYLSKHKDKPELLAKYQAELADIERQLSCS